MREETRRFRQRLLVWKDCNDGMFSRTLQLLLSMWHLAVSHCLWIVSMASKQAEGSFENPDSYIYHRMPEYYPFTFFPELQEGDGGKLPVLVIMSRFIRRMQKYSQTEVADIIRKRLYIVLTFTIGNDDLKSTLRWWLYGCRPAGISESTIGKLYPQVASVDIGKCNDRHKTMTLLHSSQQYISDYIYATLKINSIAWQPGRRRGRRRHQVAYYSIYNSNWSSMYDLVFQPVRPGIQEYGMHPLTYHGVTSSNDQGNICEMLLSFGIFELGDMVTACLLYLLIIRISLGDSYPESISQYLDNVVKGLASLRSLENPASSTAFKQDQKTWEYSLEQVCHLYNIEAMREHTGLSWLRLMTHALPYLRSFLSYFSNSIFTLMDTARTRSQIRELRQAFTNCSGCESFSCLLNIPGKHISPASFCRACTEETLLPWLASHGLLETTSTCPTCSKPKHLYKKRTKSGLHIWYFRCGSRRCGKTSVSCRTGIWARTATSFQKMISIIIAVVLGDSTQKIIRDCDCSKKSVASFSGLVGEICYLSNCTDRGHRSFSYVQSDETAIGRRKYHRGRQQRKSGPLWVQTVAGIDGATGKVLYVAAEYVENRSADALEPLLTELADNDSLLVTDQLKSYKTIADRNISLFRDHETVNHSKQFANENGFSTNAVESMNNVLKSEIRKRFYHYCPPDTEVGKERLAIATYVTNCRLAQEELIPRFFQSMRFAHQILISDQ